MGISGCSGHCPSGSSPYVSAKPSAATNAPAPQGQTQIAQSMGVGRSLDMRG